MALTKLNVAIEDASVALLQGKEGQANELLKQVYDELIALSSSLPAGKIENLQPVMDVIFLAQQGRDYVYLVDILKYQLRAYLQ